jgi:hypothetical protein
MPHLVQVHAPLQAPKFWLGHFNLSDFGTDSKGRDRWTLAAMVLQMDFAVGKVVTALKDNFMYDNSLIILSADNGGITKSGGYNWPLRGEKATVSCFLCFWQLELDPPCIACAGALLFGTAVWLMKIIRTARSALLVY